MEDNNIILSPNEINNLTERIVAAYQNSVVQQNILKKSREGLFSKIIVCLIFLSIFIYVGIVLKFSYMQIVVPDSLTIAFFGAMIGEFSALGCIKIKKTKLKTEYENGNTYDEYTNIH